MTRRIFWKTAAFVALLAALLPKSADTLLWGDEPKAQGWDVSALQAMPIQNGGRIKPFESFARDTVLFVTGASGCDGVQGAELLVAWIARPELWDRSECIQITREDTKRQLGLDPKQKRFSPVDLIEKSALGQYATRIEKPQPGKKLHPRDQEVMTVLDRLAAYKAITSGESWTLVPKPLPAPWESIQSGNQSGDQNGVKRGDLAKASEIRKAFAALALAYRSQDRAGFEQSSRLLRSQVESQVDQWESGVAGRVHAESIYNRVHPFRWAWVLYVVAAIAWAFQSKRLGSAGAIAAMGAAFLFHAGGMVVRSYIAGRPPVSNMYESVVWVSFGVVVFAGILHRVQKQTVGLWAASILAALGLVAADLAPVILDASIRPLTPVLNSNYWLTIHVLTITLGYAAFAFTLGVANVSLYHQVLKRAGHAKQVASLNELTYRAMQFGVVLLAAGTILGGVWADYSWGRFWGWDPKEVWALIALLSYVAVLHGRFTGWMGQFGYAAWTVVAFTSVVMAWYGVNFVLGEGKHSYGFAAGGRGVVFTVVALQLGYVAFCAFLRRRPGAR